jgi:hypothetical protein
MIIRRCDHKCGEKSGLAVCWDNFLRSIFFPGANLACCYPWLRNREHLYHTKLPANRYFPPPEGLFEGSRVGFYGAVQIPVAHM